MLEVLEGRLYCTHSRQRLPCSPAPSPSPLLPSSPSLPRHPSSSRVFGDRQSLREDDEVGYCAACRRQQHQNKQASEHAAAEEREREGGGGVRLGMDGQRGGERVEAGVSSSPSCSPGIVDGAVSTVKMEGSGWSKATALIGQNLVKSYL
jgi:hypothetical protein